MKRLIIYAIIILSLTVLTIIFNCLCLIGWVETIFAWTFFLPIFVDLGYMAITKIWQSKILAIKYLINLCIYINRLIKLETQTNENRNNFDISKAQSEREKRIVIENKLTEPIDIKSIPVKIIKGQEKDIINHLNLLYSNQNTKNESEKINSNPKHLLIIIQNQIDKIKVTEQEKILNDLQIEKLGINKGFV